MHNLDKQKTTPAPKTLAGMRGLTIGLQKKLLKDLFSVTQLGNFDK
jgi:hypothetical protein